MAKRCINCIPLSTRLWPSGVLTVSRSLNSRWRGTSSQEVRQLLLRPSSGCLRPRPTPRGTRRSRLVLHYYYAPAQAVYVPAPTPPPSPDPPGNQAPHVSITLLPRPSSGCLRPPPHPPGNQAPQVSITLLLRPSSGCLRPRPTPRGTRRRRFV